MSDRSKPRKQRTVKQSPKTGTISREEAERAVVAVKEKMASSDPRQILKEKMASETGRLAENLQKASIDRTVTEASKNKDELQKGEWVYDVEDGKFHGFITEISEENGEVCYRVTAPTSHVANAKERKLPASQVKRHVPKEFRK